LRFEHPPAGHDGCPEVFHEQWLYDWQSVWGRPWHGNVIRTERLAFDENSGWK
jgi:hypothetical protein